MALTVTFAIGFGAKEEMLIEDYFILSMFQSWKMMPFPKINLFYLLEIELHCDVNYNVRNKSIQCIYILAS